MPLFVLLGNNSFFSAPRLNVTAVVARACGAYVIISTLLPSSPLSACVCVCGWATERLWWGLGNIWGSTSFLFLCWTPLKAGSERNHCSPLSFPLTGKFHARAQSAAPPPPPPSLTLQIWWGWSDCRLSPLWKPITTNPIMSLECSVDAANGLRKRPQQTTSPPPPLPWR